MHSLSEMLLIMMCVGGGALRSWDQVIEALAIAATSNANGAIVIGEFCLIHCGSRCDAMKEGRGSGFKG